VGKKYNSGMSARSPFQHVPYPAYSCPFFCPQIFCPPFFARPFCYTGASKLPFYCTSICLQGTSFRYNRVTTSLRPKAVHKKSVMMRDRAVMDSASDSDEYVERVRRTSRTGRRQWCRLRGLDESESGNQDRVLLDALRY
jgi:hypothetical protein